MLIAAHRPDLVSSCIFGLHGCEQVHRKRRILWCLHRLHSHFQGRVSVFFVLRLLPPPTHPQVDTVVPGEIRNRRHPRSEHILRDQRLRDRKRRGRYGRAMQTSRGQRAGKGNSPNLAHFPERRHLLHLETTTKVTLLVFHYSEPSSSQETTEPVCTNYNTSVTTPNRTHTAQPW